MCWKTNAFRTPVVYNLERNELIAALVGIVVEGEEVIAHVHETIVLIPKALKSRERMCAVRILFNVLLFDVITNMF